MITIFTIPKAFHGHSGLIQANAVRSWKALGPDVEVLLCGDDAGVEEAASRFGVGFIRDVARNEFGTPLVSSAFERALRVSKKELLCYVNADILLLGDFREGVRRVAATSRFLMVGQRVDLDLDVALDFDSEAWREDLEARVEATGKWHGPHGSDYFVFRRDRELCSLPPFAVGRPGWDCWLIYHARRIGIPVIDGSPAIRPIHQNHDYGHVPAASGSTEDGRIWTGPESERHKELIGGIDYYFTPLDATHVLTSRGVRRALDFAHLRQRWHRLPVLHPRLAPVVSSLERLVPASLKRLVGSMLPALPSPESPPK